MAFTQTQQILELIRKSDSILVACQKDWSGDSLAASLALAEWLRNSGKKAIVACDGFEVPANLPFLPTYQIRPTLGSLQKFIISLDTSRTKPADFAFDQQGERLDIYVTPEDGSFDERDVRASTSDYVYDLVFTIGTPDLNSLGGIYSGNSEFFYAKPKINVDQSPLNEYFGNINLVNIAASSNSEIIHDLLKELSADGIDENIATYLLGGIIMATKNFKALEVTPRTLNLASELIGQGARREQIIQSLYQNRYISTLKLWGRALSRLNSDLDDRVVWSALAESDFVETATSPTELPDVIEELILAMPKTEVVALFYQSDRRPGAIEAIIHSAKKLDALRVAQAFNPSGNRETARILLENSNLAEAERTIVTEIKRKVTEVAA